VLVYAGAWLVTERLNVEPKGSHVQKGPQWEKGLEKQIKELRAKHSSNFAGVAEGHTEEKEREIPA